MLRIVVEEIYGSYIIHDHHEVDNTFHILELVVEHTKAWSDIVTYVWNKVQYYGRDDYIRVDVDNKVIYCNTQYPTNVTYVLDLVDEYCNIYKSHSTIKTNSSSESNIKILLYQWIGRKSNVLGNKRLMFYSSIACLLFMMLASGFFVLFVQVLT